MNATTTPDLVTRAKENAAHAALDFVEDGMTLGLGSGSTAEAFIAALGERIARTGITVRGLPTSEATAKAAREAGVALIEPDQAERIHLTVDGADEIDPFLNLIKGGGACLLREKIIAHASDHMVVIADEAKLVDRLGAFALPVEVDPFAFTITAKKVFDALRASGASGHEVVLRTDEDANPVVTDGGHYLLDCAAEAIPEPEDLARWLRRIPGVVEHGLFIDLARTVLIGRHDGETVDVIDR